MTTSALHIRINLIVQTARYLVQVAEVAQEVINACNVTQATG
jgi:hypothetical protein